MNGCFIISESSFIMKSDYQKVRPEVGKFNRYLGIREIMIDNCNPTIVVTSAFRTRGVRTRLVRMARVLV